MFGIPLFDLAWLTLALLIAGGLTGLLAGVFGVGGGALAVPVLYELFTYLDVPEQVRMPLCVGTSLAVIIPTSIRSFLAHRAKGAVDMSILKIWAVPVVVGVLVGSVIARYAPAELFKAVFVGVAGVSALRLLLGKDSWNFGTSMPGRALMIFYGWIIGILSALMGIGGGQLSSLFMTFYGRPIHQAVATSSGLGILISVPGTLGYIYAGWPRAAEFPDVSALQPPLALGYVSILGLAAFIPTSTLAAPLGAKLAHTLSRRQLEIAFGIFLLFVCARFLVDLFD
ncbi:MAG TPA: sulfite exporter TauE/SafE family protein [Rhizobiaceae bacterium]|nr:sulfite exporter TauE/SafE family protein [Rhizobiaceae bacterium]